MSDPANGTLRYRVDRMERDLIDLERAIQGLNGKIDRLILTFVTGVIALTVAIIAATVTLLAQG